MFEVIKVEQRDLSQLHFRPLALGGANRYTWGIRSILAVGIFALGFAALTQSQPHQENAIQVDIGGLHNDKGQVVCALFSSPANFPKKTESALARATSDISHGAATCEFPGISPGTYAVSVFHDENSNGKLDTNFMGIPREGVGASNNPKGHLGPPKFSAAAFAFAGGRLDLKITIHYL